MASHRLRDLRGPARRDFLRWSVAAAAAVGLERAGLLNFLADQGGSALADDSCASANRSIHIVCGNGSFAWFQLLWPQVDVAMSNNPGFAFHAYGQGFLDATADMPIYYGPEAPWVQNGKALRPVTAFMAGKDETHTQFPESAAIVGSNAGMIATAASIQTVMPTLVPVIGMDPLKFGDANGAPSIATVPSAQGMIDLFNSVSSQLTLAAQADKEIFETYYKAMVGIRRAAARPSWQPHLETTKKASRLIGFNYGPELTPSQGDLQAYGLTTLQASVADGSQKEKLDNFGRAMITAAKAMKLGLTNCVIIGVSPGPTGDTTFTDPHITFASQSRINSATASVAALGAILNGFYADLATTDDPACSGTTMDENCVLTVHGDTPHNPLTAGGNWEDQMPQACNWLYVMGAGHLKSGWFGSLHTNGTTDGFDPATGATIANQDSLKTSTAAGAAVAYAIAKGNMNKVSEYYSGGPITGLIKT